MDIDQLLDELPEDDSVSTLAVDADIVLPSGPCCEKCAAPLSALESLVCQQCGWYASINSYVEIDRSWEVATDPELATGEDTKPAPSAKLPTWAWILAGCVVGVVVESVAVRLLTSGGGLRTLWSLTQLFFGFVAFTFCHTLCFLQVMKNEADVKMLDYLLRPIKTWSIIFRGMPERAWVCYVGLTGLTAVAMSLLVIGGIPYERLLDWNVEKKAKFNLMGAILDQAQGNGKDDDKSLEEAVNDFAGQAELDEDKKKKAAKKVRHKEDCIIIGYMTNQAGEIRTLLLAAEHYSKLRYAGNVQVTGLPEEDLQALTKKLAASRTHKPFVRISIDGATWVKPKHLVRVSYKRRGKKGGLYGAKLEDMLGEVDLGSQ